jgi:hypothetical protein
LLHPLYQPGEGLAQHGHELVPWLELLEVWQERGVVLLPESREAWKGQENLGVVQVVVLVLSGREEDWEVDCWSFWWSGLTSA